MTQRSDIFDFISHSLNATVTLRDLYTAFSFPKPSIRRVVNIATKKGDLERISRSTYRLANVYFKIAMTKTARYHGERQRKGEQDVRIDATIAGWVNRSQINFSSNTINENLEENLNREFVQHIIYLIEKFDSASFTAVMEADGMNFEVEGVEIRFNDYNYVRTSYDKYWTVEYIKVEIGAWKKTVAKNELVIINENDLY